MKNILISIVTVLIVVLIVLCMYRGVVFGNITILSINQIIEKNDEIDKKIDEINSLNNVSYKSALTSLNDATKKLTTGKSEYLDVASISSDEEIREANQTRTYAMEYLWSQIGNHATSEGVNIKLEISSTGASNRNTLNFTVVGSYIAIRNFVYSIENDVNLEFRIDSFKLASNGSGAEQLKATFTVADIEIKKENISNSSNNSSASSNESDKTAKNAINQNNETVDNTIIKNENNDIDNNTVSQK